VNEDEHTATEKGDDVAPSRPTAEEFADLAERLLREVDQELSTNRWAILNIETKHATWRRYDMAALRHCCGLVREIEAATAGGLEFAVRTLGRAHMEAWLTALYVHFGGHEAVVRVDQNTEYQTKALANDSQEFDKWLKSERKAAHRSARKVEKRNEHISLRNASNPELPPVPLLSAPHIPQLAEARVDLRDRMDGTDPVPLPVRDVVDLLTKLAVEKGFGQESFWPVYLIYRALSMIGTHPTMHVLRSYLTAGGFVRSSASLQTDSAAETVRIWSIHGTAFLAGRVLGDAGCPTPVADEVRWRLESTPSGGSPWAPGI
jgi:hypothetical protein